MGYEVHHGYAIVGTLNATTDNQYILQQNPNLTLSINATIGYVDLQDM